MEIGISHKQLAWIVALSALLVMLPISTQAEVRVHLSDIKGRLPELQKAVGKDWTVTALPDGYLVTYLPLVSFYPAISENSKLDNHQRAAHGRLDHLQIKITFLDPPTTTERINQYNSYLMSHSPAPGFFGCGAEDWSMWPAASIQTVVWVPSDQQPVVCFASNIAPDELVSPRETQDVYEQTLDALALVFHCSRYSSIED